MQTMMLFMLGLSLALVQSVVGWMASSAFHSNPILLSSGNTFGSYGIPLSSKNAPIRVNTCLPAANVGLSYLQNDIFSDEEKDFGQFTEKDKDCIISLHAQLRQNQSAMDSTEGVQQFLQEKLSKAEISESLVMKLNQIQSDEESGDSSGQELGDTASVTHAFVKQVANALDSLVEKQLLRARETLFMILNAGEIRKLDTVIGDMMKQDRLDSAFFNVLYLNLQDAVDKEQAHQEGEDMDNNGAEEGESGAEPTASRAQILKHIFTRCQEEIEKARLPPGLAFLNRVLRTDNPSIRDNLYRHYLTPQANNVITTPDGKQVELKNSNSTAVLLSLDDFISGFETAVLEFRTMEASEALDRESSATLVESCRQVAKEVRLVLIDAYGADSETVSNFQDRLEPVFRPKSADSPFISGKAA